MCIHTQIDEVAEVKIGGFRVGWVVAGAPKVGGVGWWGLDATYEREGNKHVW